MSAPLHIVLVPHTHWDREWYQTFQQFRIRLIKTIDKLLNILDQDEAFRFFLLDGQTIVLDDYLEVRPEQEERLKRHIRNGRILIGPWYVQPDEFLVSGEALIRNLQRGLRQAAAFGDVMRVGYVPDTFGHIAQLPQILQGCDIDSAVFWRGVKADIGQSEFYWEAPDGSRVLAIHLADPIGYSNARQLPMHTDEFISRIELLISNILPHATTNTLLFMNGSDHLEPQAGLPALIEQANTHLSQLDSRLQHFLTTTASNGHRTQPEQYDAIRIQIGTLPQYIERIRQQKNLTTFQGELRSSQQAHLLPGVLSARIWLKQQNTATEHLLERWVEPLTAWASLLGIDYPQGLVQLAWRYLLQNHAHDSICGCSIDQVHRENAIRFSQSQQIAEGLLSQTMQQLAKRIDTRAPFPVANRTLEPLAIVVFNPAPGPRTDIVKVEVELPGTLQQAEIVDEQGQRMPYTVLNRWRQVIGSMPIARDVFASAVTLADITTPEQLLAMAESTIVTALGQEEQTHAITHIHIEQSHVTTTGTVSIEIMIAPRGRVSINERELYAAVRQIMELLQREDITTFDFTLIDQARETIEFLAAALPAYGYKTFWLYPQGRKDPSVTTLKTHLSTSKNTIENEYFRVEADSQDGTLILVDKQTNMIFTGLNRFVEGGDIGDPYTYCPPEQDQIISEPIEPPRIDILSMGPVRATLRVSGRYTFPGLCAANRQERSTRTTTCPITSEITLIPGVRRVEIHTSIENKAKDHRLRVVFPVSYKVDEATAEGTFEVRTRPARQNVPTDTKEWAEQPVHTYPQKRFVDISNGEVGLGILNRGLPEYEVVHDGDPGLSSQPAGIALTLLRGVEWLSRGDLSTRHGHAAPPEQTPEAQCLGHHAFDYALVPHRGHWDSEDALVLQEAQIFNTPIVKRAVVTEQHPGEQSAEATLITVTPGEIVVSAVLNHEQGTGLVVRVYNPLERQITATISSTVAFQQVYVANLLGECQQPITISSSDNRHSGGEPAGTTIQLTLPGGAIRTVVFETCREGDTHTKMGE